MIKAVFTASISNHPLRCRYHKDRKVLCSVKSRNNWTLVREFYEKGISGYKCSLSDRDVIKKMMKEAANNQFDILLIYSFDRIGRRNEETASIVEWLYSQGIRVCSVMEGFQNFHNHEDRLQNYLWYWQGCNESKKQSMRIEDAHKHMVEAGLFRGGKAPYGYKLEKSDKFSKTGKSLCKLVVDEDTAPIVQLIYNLVYNKHYGGNTICKYLNEAQIPSHYGKKWTLSSVNYVLRNPIYKGYMVFGKTNKNGARVDRDSWIYSKSRNHNLVIVEQDIWDAVQNIRAARTPKNMKKTNIECINSNKDQLLFVGFIWCGYCNSRMSTTYNYKYWTLKNGDQKKKIRVKYRCNGKQQSRKECSGQTIYAKEKIESLALDEVLKFAHTLKDIYLTNLIKSLALQNESEQESLRKLHKDLEKYYKVLFKCEDNSKSGYQNVSTERTNFESQLEQTIFDTGTMINRMEESIKERDGRIQELIIIRKALQEWDLHFDKVSHGEKRVLLRYMIDNIVVYRDKVAVTFQSDLMSIVES